MSQQRVYKTKTVKRMDECAKEQEQNEYNEVMRNARRASKKARQATKVAADLVMQINEMV